jgi:hypothetical protein
MVSVFGGSADPTVTGGGGGGAGSSILVSCGA